MSAAAKALIGLLAVALLEGARAIVWAADESEEELGTKTQKGDEMSQGNGRFY